jgi:30S ribosomal protein S31
MIATTCAKQNATRDTFGGWTMGKGDVRTKRGKIYNGSYGKTRPHKLKKKAPATAAARVAPRRPA